MFYNICTTETLTAIWLFQEIDNSTDAIDNQ